MSQALIEALQNPALYPHPVGSFQVIETHISWVLLTGEYAYKIKKPVNFGFLDFTQLSDREHFCGEELRLNQRLTEDLYLEVIPVCGSVEAPNLANDGPVIEYALKMRQFPQDQLLSEVQARGELSEAHIDELAEKIAQFHLSAPQVAQDHGLGTPEAVMTPVLQNFEQARPMLSEKADLEQLDALQAWAETSYERLKPLLAKRKADGFIRECHGDIHLGNIAILDGHVTLFDCIEFNQPFRMTDVMADVGFLVMDLEDRGLKCLARRFVSKWLEYTGDYASLELLNFYKAYRAMVRGKVSLFRLGQEQSAVQRKVILRQYRKYAALAESYSSIPSRFLAITHGVSAVGKSQVAMRMVEALGAIRLRSDVERKRLFGEQSEAQKGQQDQGIYDQDSSIATYRRLHEIADAALHAGFPVVIDATYLKLEQRQAAMQVAEQTGVPFLILSCNAPTEVIAGWLKHRQQEAKDPSDATMQVIEVQLANREALTATERVNEQCIETNDSASLDSLVARIRQRLPGL